VAGTQDLAGPIVSPHPELPTPGRWLSRPGKREQSNDCVTRIRAERRPAVRQSLHELAEVAADEFVALLGGVDSQASTVAARVSGTPREAASFESVNEFGDAAAGDGEATFELSRGEAVGLVGEVVEGGVLGVGHPGAGSALGDHLLARQEQLVQEGGDVTGHGSPSTLPAERAGVV
jgi:hypothetical protein